MLEVIMRTWINKTNSPRPYLPPGWRAAGRSRPAPALWSGLGTPSCWTSGRCRWCRLAGWWRWSSPSRRLESGRRSALWPDGKQNDRKTGASLDWAENVGAQAFNTSAAVCWSDQKADGWPESNHRNRLEVRPAWTSTHIYSIKPRRRESHWENTITHSPWFWLL